jgi:hypothetical protein
MGRPRRLRNDVITAVASVFAAALLLSSCARLSACATGEQHGCVEKRFAVSAREHVVAIDWQVKNVRLDRDRVRDQVRWSYELELTNRSTDHVVHLTHLRRRTVNDVDTIGDTGHVARTEEFWLDLVRADLRLEPNRPVSLRCAESFLGGRGPTPAALSAGSYHVWRSYEGEISPVHGEAFFVPVTVPIHSRFELVWSTTETPKPPIRPLEWIWIGNECVTCRAPVYCQKLADEKREFSVVADESVYVAVGTDPRPLWMRYDDAELLRVAMCTRWFAEDNPAIHVWRCAHGTDSGLGRASPFLVLQTSMKTRRLRELHPGAWAVEICMHEAEDLPASHCEDEPVSVQHPGTCLKELVKFTVK